METCSWAGRATGQRPFGSVIIGECGICGGCFIHPCRVDLDFESGTYFYKSAAFSIELRARAGGAAIINSEIPGSLGGFSGPNLESCRLL
jgi:hypothetical protein